MRTSYKIRADLGSEIPLYRQIADAFRTRLVAGELETGDRLPSIRGLAIELGVHFNTVAEAYRVLAAEGWIELKRRSGAVVVERRRPQRPGAGRTAECARRLRDFVASMQAEGISATALARELRRIAESVLPESKGFEGKPS